MTRTTTTPRVRRDDWYATIPEGIKRRLPTLRMEHGWTQEDLALRARVHGLRWDYVTVKNIETGVRVVSIAEWFMLLVIFDVSAEQFFGEITVLLPSPAVGLRPADLKDILAGRSGLSPSDAMAEALRQEEETLPARRVAEEKAARALRVDVADIDEATWRLWGTTLTQERDRQLGLTAGDRNARSRQALRGHITRRLLKELREAGVGAPVPKRKKKSPAADERKKKKG